MAEIVLVLTTVADDGDAEKIARTLVEEGLAACVNVSAPMTSIYRWQGKVERSTERQVVVKTTRDRVAAIESRVRALHPYELPEFIVLSGTGGSEQYLKWIAHNVGA